MLDMLLENVRAMWSVVRRCVSVYASVYVCRLSQVQRPPPFDGGTAMEAGALVRMSSTGHRNDGERGIVI